MTFILGDIGLWMTLDHLETHGRASLNDPTKQNATISTRVHFKQHSPNHRNKKPLNQKLFKIKFLSSLQTKIVFTKQTA